MNVVSKDNPLKHYQWGKGCDGWVFVDEETLSVKMESMPSGTEETLHYHEHAQQFFFILKGRAAFEIDGIVVMLYENQGIQIKPGQRHRIMNVSEDELQFVLCSQPATEHDRINII